MSLLTLQPSRLRCDGLAAFAFSQSGRSPDLVSSTRQLRAAGAATVAFVNEATSPLADAAQWTVPIRAGSETSVAATKSFIAQLAAGARLVSAWQGDAELLDALRALPQALTAAASSDWTAALPQLANAERLYVVGRGTGLAIAQEAALKFKETCGIQAEAFSSAELRHGPMALVGAGFPVLVLALRGPAQAGLLTLADELRARGAAVLLVAPAGTAGVDLPLVTALQADLDGITAVQSFYLMVEALARLRRYDPDAPAHLSKVTLTH
jgi:glucosamine--fructose-6-phosphate aminotransferase (isomerizing)